MNNRLDAKIKALPPEFIGTTSLKKAENDSAESVKSTGKYLVFGCPELSKTEWFLKHSKAATYNQWNLCKRYEINATVKWYDHVPETIVKKDNVAIHETLSSIQTEPYQLNS